MKVLSRNNAAVATLLSLAAAATLAQTPAAPLPQFPPPPVVGAPGNAPPSDAVVLFGGKGTEAWETIEYDREKKAYIPAPGPIRWKIENGAMVVVSTVEGARPGSIRTKQGFGDVQLHLEFRTPSPPSGS